MGSRLRGNDKAGCCDSTVFNRKQGAVMEDTLITLFCIVDEFFNEFYPEWEKTLISQGIKKRRRPSKISPSEIMTIFIYFHVLRFRPKTCSRFGKAFSWKIIRR